MSTIDKKKSLIIFSCAVITVIVIIFAIFYFKKQYTEVMPQFWSKAQLISNVDVDKNKDNEEKEKNIPKVEVDKEITIYNSSEEIIFLKTRDWYFPEVDFEGEYVVEGLKYHYEKFTIERIDKTIIRIVFNENYKEEIVSGITVGMNTTDVKEILGKPFFNNEDYNMIGYKTKNLYLCIYDDEIAVYRNKYFSNEELENLIIKYYNKEFKGSRNEFARYIMNSYEDFKFTADEDKNIYLTSPVRGIIIKIGENNNDIGVEYYKEYDSINVLGTNIPDIVTIKDKYFVELMEIERKLEK